MLGLVTQSSDRLICLDNDRRGRIDEPGAANPVRTKHEPDIP
jgi:hypothetical protein